MIRFPDLDQHLLRLRDEVAGGLAALLRELDDVLSGAEQAPEDRELANRLRVMGGVGRGRHDLGDLVNSRLAPGGGRLSGLLELRVDGDRIDRVPGAPERDGRAKDRGEVVAVEIARRDVLENGRDSGLGAEDGPNDRDLRVLVVQELGCRFR